MRQVTAALVEKNGKILLALRKAGKHMGRKWEFPGGKVDPGEKPEQALRRELSEEFSISAEIGEFLASTRYREKRLDLEILLYRATHLSGGFVLREHEEIRWVDPHEVETFDLVDSDRKLFRKFLQRLT
ncbi:MAG: (deoxy)nucleoside triphosphate pyrophosphohydrolase [Spirochaetaceae bacterium]|nr:MAG: (deoxy)nucleoside triphosphate pyrophosphohydrolase [Spirochaetaceae bacterium]